MSETDDDERTIGGYLQEQLGWRNVLFVTGGVRVDKTSTRGPAIGATYYPEVNGSYVISDEAFFPKQDVVNTVKLRSGIGQSGLRPTQLQSLSYYGAIGSTVPPTFQTTAPAPLVGGQSLGGGLGNPDLKPEISTEYEFGGDFGFAKDRATLSVTYYHKQTHDALVAANVVLRAARRASSTSTSARCSTAAGNSTATSTRSSRLGRFRPRRDLLDAAELRHHVGQRAIPGDLRPGRQHAGNHAGLPGGRVFPAADLV